MDHILGLDVPVVIVSTIRHATVDITHVLFIFFDQVHAAALYGNTLLHGLLSAHVGMRMEVSGN